MATRQPDRYIIRLFLASSSNAEVMITAVNTYLAISIKKICDLLPDRYPLHNFFRHGKFKLKYLDDKIIMC